MFGNMGDKCGSCWDFCERGGLCNTYIDKCYQTCPEEEPRQAITTCRAYEDNLFFDPDLNACVEKCPIAKPAPTRNRYCKTCVALDPTKPFWTGSACEACSEINGGMYWDGTTCVTKCPDTAPMVGENNFCRKCIVDEFNDRGNYFDPETNTYVKACPEKTPMPSSNNVCKTCIDIDPDKPLF